MADYLDNLAQRTLDLVGVIHPRLPALFETPPGAGDLELDIHPGGAAVLPGNESRRPAFLSAPGKATAVTMESPLLAPAIEQLEERSAGDSQLPGIRRRPVPVNSGRIEEAIEPPQPHPATLVVPIPALSMGRNTPARPALEVPGHHPLTPSQRADLASADPIPTATAPGTLGNMAASPPLTAGRPAGQPVPIPAPVEGAATAE
ncbi:MAG: hypothetical protein L0322_14455, partial [Chloroflexi bacterium]|nr:hypothetical protein [Chloroflexota bacterium]